MDRFSDEEGGEKKVEEFQNQFKSKAWLYKDKPVTNRSVTDPCCLIFFIICFGGFIGYSAYSLNTTIKESQTGFGQNLSGTFLEGVKFEQLKIFVIIMLSCFGGAIFVSLIICGMFFLIPVKTIYILAVSGALVLIGLGIFLARVPGLSGFPGYFFVLGFFYIVFLCYLHEYFEKAAILMKTVAAFIKENLKIIFLVFIALVYSLIVVSLWGLGFYAFITLYSKGTLSYAGFVWSSIFWAFLLFFFNFYFYYTSVFLTSYSLSIWFYQKEDMDGIGTPLKHMLYHIGTITFASLLIAFLKMLKFLIAITMCRKCQGVGIFALIGALLACIICCILGALEPLLTVLNTNSIVVCALTGESFLDSADIAGHVGFSDYQTFTAFSYTGYVIQFGAVICVSTIPTIVGAVMLNSLIGNTYLTIVGSLLIFFVSSIIGQVILQVFIESIHTLFMLYRLDTQLIENGHEVTWVQQFGKQLDTSFDEAFVEQIKRKPKPKYKKVTTVVVHQNGMTEVYKNRVQVPQGEEQNMKNKEQTSQMQIQEM